MITKVYINIALLLSAFTFTRANECLNESIEPLPFANIRIENSKKSNLLDMFKKVIDADNLKLDKIVRSSESKVSGIVSWYSDKFHGRKTSSGEPYNKNNYTAAHRTLPFGTKVKITNVRNGKSVVAKINDRGPYAKSRLLDLSRAAFSSIGSVDSGIIKVYMEILD